MREYLTLRCDFKTRLIFKFMLRVKVKIQIQGPLWGPLVGLGQDFININGFG